MVTRSNRSEKIDLEKMSTHDEPSEKSENPSKNANLGKTQNPSQFARDMKGIDTKMITSILATNPLKKLGSNRN